MRVQAQNPSVRPWACVRKLRILVTWSSSRPPKFTALIAEYMEDDEYRAVGAGTQQAERAGGCLIWLVRKYPDTLKRLESLAASA